MKIKKKLFFPALVILITIIIAVVINLNAVQRNVEIIYKFSILNN